MDWHTCIIREETPAIIRCMGYSTIFFDLDDTLYDSRNGLWNAIRDRMGLYMADRLHLPSDEIQQLRRHYYLTYGTTLRGLQLHHQVDAEDFLAFVHDLPLQNYLHPVPGSREFLLTLPQQRWIFTNADANHASRVISHLQLQDCFEGIIDLHAMQFACKPEAAAYERALQVAGEPDPQHCVMLDDAVVNLDAARRMGFTTVWVTPDSPLSPDGSYQISHIMQLRQVLPELWQN